MEAMCFSLRTTKNNKRLKKSHKESDEILGSREVNFDYPYSVVLFKYLIKAQWFNFILGLIFYIYPCFDLVCHKLAYEKANSKLIQGQF